MGMLAITKVKRSGGISTFHLVPVNTSPINNSTEKFPLLSWNFVNIDTAAAIGGGWSADMPGVITIPPTATHFDATCHQDWPTQSDPTATNTDPRAGYHFFYEGTCASDYVIGAVNDNSGSSTGEDNYHMHAVLPLTPNVTGDYFNPPPPTVLHGLTFPVFSIPMVDLGGGTATYNLEVAGFDAGTNVVLDDFESATQILDSAMGLIPIPSGNLNLSGRPGNAADMRLWVPLSNNAWGFGKGPDYIRVNISAISNMTIAGASTPGSYNLPRVGMRVTFPMLQTSGVDLVMGAGPYTSATVVSYREGTIGTVTGPPDNEQVQLSWITEDNGTLAPSTTYYYKLIKLNGVGVATTNGVQDVTSDADGNLIVNVYQNATYIFSSNSRLNPSTEIVTTTVNLTPKSIVG